MPGRLLGPADALRPDRPVGPDVDLLDRPEDARSGCTSTPCAEAVVGGALVAHLGARASSRRPASRITRASSTDQVSGFWQKQCLPIRMAMTLAGAWRVVGRADGDGVDLVAQLLEHLAVVVVLLRLGVLRRPSCRGVLSSMSQRATISPCRPGVVGVAVPLAADADAGEADLLVRRTGTGRTGEGRGPARKNGPGDAGQRGLRQEIASFHDPWHSMETGRRDAPHPCACLEGQKRSRAPARVAR